jgi:hypothetical protein
MLSGLGFIVYFSLFVFGSNLVFGRNFHATNAELYRIRTDAPEFVKQRTQVAAGSRGTIERIMIAMRSRVFLDAPVIRAASHKSGRLKRSRKLLSRRRVTRMHPFDFITALTTHPNLIRHGTSLLVGWRWVKPGV